MFLNVANGAGPGLGAVRRNVPRIVRTREGAVIRMPLVMRPRGVGAARGMGAALFTRPGANGGTQIVDSGGNTVYTPEQVASTPGLLNQLAASSGCANGTLPEWFPGAAATGGGPVCGDPSAIVPGEGNSPFAQFEYPVNGQCNQNVWCMVGSNPNDPNSYVWNGAGQPDTMNPAYVRSGGVPYAFPTPETFPISTSPGSVPFTPFVASPNPPAVFVSSDPVPRLNPPALVAATATISNTSRPGQPFQVGDAWKLVVAGTPNQPVSGTASQNGKSLGTTPYGSTDSTGSLVLTGSMDASTVGAWSELWTVGTVSAPVISFSVSAAQPLDSSAPSGSSSGGGGGAAATTGGFADFFTQSVDIGGVSIPVWGLVAAGVGGLLLFSGGKSR